jgi:transcriptional regulator with XRE-family HTH domain
VGRAAWFGGRLRELREQRQLTQPQLADKAGMNKDALARLERGERSPTWETVVALTEALAVSPEAFLQEPAARQPAGPGRRAKPKDEEEKPKRPRGRPRKQAAAEAPRAEPKKSRKRKGEGS